jgi:hypothetical protein
MLSSDALPIDAQENGSPTSVALSDGVAYLIEWLRQESLREVDQDGASEV